MSATINPPDRRRGRELGRALAGLTVIAAGIGGWFAFERIALADDETDVVPAPEVAPPPVPPDLLVHDTTWESFHLVVESGGAVTRQVWFDEPSGQFRHIYLTRDGDVRDTTTDVSDLALRAGQRGTSRSAAATGDTAPIHLGAVMIDATNPFVSLVSDTPIDSGRRLVVRIDGAGFSGTVPTVASAWALDLGIERSDQMTWTLDVRADGYIERWEGRTAGHVETWAELTAPTGGPNAALDGG